MRAPVLIVAAVILGTGCSSASRPPLKEIQRVRSGNTDVVLLSPDEGLHQGKNAAVLEFRDISGALTDVGMVRVNATMPMAGMAPMMAGAEVRPTETKGRYDVACDFNMAGTWRMGVDWDGPAGRGSVTLPGTVR